ncbi:MAG: 23S rRNA (adenine(2503)-C(2))-methyltransferase RlmN [Clostridia bacterium]|nr:23S rRNA (adenine(2503)-C(2))-methyltransferase RlmN [Clostridia bacterium]
METKKADLLSLDLSETEALVASMGEARYRAEQLFVGMHKGVSPAEMTNLGKSFKEKLSELAYFYIPTVERKLVSKIDGTIKYLFLLNDGNCVESVVMKYKHGNTICISSQVGCRMGCAFCASTIGGKVRDLRPSELLGQVIAASLDCGERISNIVMMGIGEPLDNYDNVIKFLRLVGHEKGLNIGYRHISLSTCGIVDKIKKLADEDLAITLSISLHASDDETRSSIMPINKKWSIDELLDACKYYFSKTGRRISFEYTLISGKNDSAEAAKRLARLLNSRLRSRTETMPIHVNLIPVNEVSENDFVRSDKRSVERFAEILNGLGIRATVRRRLGADINASCGQLRRAREAENDK